MMNAPLTVFRPDPVETGKTDETTSSATMNFCDGLWRRAWAEARPVVVSFKGNPRTVPKKVWFGRPWQGNSAQAERPAGRRQ